MSPPNCSALQSVVCTDTEPQLLEAAVAQSFNAVVITNAEVQGVGPVITYWNAAFRTHDWLHLKELLGRSPRMLQGAETDA